ncbi:hypothetical protein QBC40DRAFT_20780 [Triangularia verruculosa]|uniref:Uncharacterized protein n=1 Tax=Triangularia verruculosa TaxID=2587418 RepID=A0AAN6XND9_9PEZI|nr:hypothetical protein QBC40DRAFT_20780 [Triangularia verruculosa]
MLNALQQKVRHDFGVFNGFCPPSIAVSTKTLWLSGPQNSRHLLKKSHNSSFCARRGPLFFGVWGPPGCWSSRPRSPGQGSVFTSSSTKNAPRLRTRHRDNDISAVHQLVRSSAAVSTRPAHSINSSNLDRDTRVGLKTITSISSSLGLPSPKFQYRHSGNILAAECQQHSLFPTRLRRVTGPRSESTLYLSRVWAEVPPYMNYGMYAQWQEADRNTLCA